jgi:hypothetical protein
VPFCQLGKGITPVEISVNPAGALGGCASLNTNGCNVIIQQKIFIGTLDDFVVKNQTGIMSMFSLAILVRNFRYNKGYSHRVSKLSISRQKEIVPTGRNLILNPSDSKFHASNIQ